jgi:hypothetical protein
VQPARGGAELAAMLQSASVRIARAAVFAVLVSSVSTTYTFNPFR